MYIVFQSLWLFFAILIWHELIIDQIYSVQRYTNIAACGYFYQVINILLGFMSRMIRNKLL